MFDERPRAATGDQLLSFFAITFAFSWLLWLLPLLRSTVLPELPEWVGLFGMFAPFGPGVAAFWLVRRAHGREGVRHLWLRGWRLGFEKKWLVVALVLGPAVGLLNVIGVVALGGEIDWGSGVGPAMVVPVFVLIYFANALPEEYGWRGYALDPLQQRFEPVRASLILGVVWGLWHLPLVFIDGTTQAAIPFHEYILQTVVLAILYTWLYNNTGGSVLVAAVFHASANAAGAAIPTWTTALGRWINFVLLAIVAAVVIRRSGSMRLSALPERQPLP